MGPTMPLHPLFPSPNVGSLAGHEARESPGGRPLPNLAIPAARWVDAVHAPQSLDCCRREPEQGA
jgi:hypothetical protein